MEILSGFVLKFGAKRGSKSPRYAPDPGRKSWCTQCTRINPNDKTFKSLCCFTNGWLYFRTFTSGKYPKVGMLDITALPHTQNNYLHTARYCFLTNIMIFSPHWVIQYDKTRKKKTISEPATFPDFFLLRLWRRSDVWDIKSERRAVTVLSRWRKQQQKGKGSRVKWP